MQRNHTSQTRIILLIAIAFFSYVAIGLPGGVLGVAWPSIRDNFALSLDAVGALFIARTAGYFAAGYGLNQIPVEHGGKAPTPRVIQASIDKAQEYNLEYVFLAPQFATENAETIAREIGGRTAFLDPLPELYIDNIREILYEQIVNCDA